MTTMGFFGILLGVVIIVGVQLSCYKLFNYEDYQKAVIVSLSCFILGILSTLLIIKLGG